MSEFITQRELGNESGEIMRRLDQGESFAVTRNCAPVGELISPWIPQFGTSVAAVALFKNAPPVDADRFRSNLDSWANQDITPNG